MRLFLLKFQVVVKILREVLVHTEETLQGCSPTHINPRSGIPEKELYLQKDEHRLKGLHMASRVLDPKL
jgi:hypothetical protein